MRGITKDNLKAARELMRDAGKCIDSAKDYEEAYDAVLANELEELWQELDAVYTKAIKMINRKEN